MAFAGTTQKCNACDKTVYLVDKLTADNRIFHKACFICHHCNGTLKLSNYNSFEGVLYCRPHFDQLFKQTGSLDKSFDGTPKIARTHKTIDGEVASSLNSSYCHILYSGSSIFTWIGNLTPPEDHDLVERQLDVIKPNMKSKLQKEGSESEIFWKLLGGKSEYPSQKTSKDTESDPHLFSFMSLNNLTLKYKYSHS